MSLGKSRTAGRHSKKIQMQGARVLMNEAYREVRRSDERRSATPQMDFFRSRPKKKNRYQVRPDNGSLWILLLLRHYQARASKVDDPNKEEQ
jgi:hypothetical protein